MLFAGAELRRGLYCFMVGPGYALEMGAARVVLSWRPDNDEIMVKHSALRDPSRQRNVANLSGFDSRAYAVK